MKYKGVQFGFNSRRLWISMCEATLNVLSWPDWKSGYKGTEEERKQRINKVRKELAELRRQAKRYAVPCGKTASYDETKQDPQCYNSVGCDSCWMKRIAYTDKLIPDCY